VTKIPYDITDAKEDIETLYREIAALENELIKKKVLDKPKQETKEEN